MKEVLLYIWQLPQNLLGLVLLLWYRLFDSYGFYQYAKEGDIVFYRTHLMPSGISLGKYVIMRHAWTSHYKAYRHEFGHTKQSKMLGPLYLFVIGIPSLVGNIIDRLFHKKWSYEKQETWYYNQPWEKWADKLGNVTR